MVFVWGDEHDRVERIRDLCASRTECVGALLADDVALPVGGVGCHPVVITVAEPGPSVLAALRRSVDAGLPTAVVYDVPTAEVAALACEGALWVGPVEDPTSAARMLDRLLGADPPGRSPWYDGLELRHPEAFGRILTGSPIVRSVLAHAELVADTSQTVLITGDTGTGKELLAHAVHAASGRTGRFVAENVSGLDDALLSDTLFGHVRGGYTGAIADRNGLVRRAAAGTLFLDEIGELTPQAQTKLLRLLENREYTPIGSDVTYTTDARFVVATNRHLPELVRRGVFRSDLYYRLAVHQLHLPPLSERPDDIPGLARVFAAQAAGEQGRPTPSLSHAFLRCLSVYSFPGNIRELRSVVHRAIVLSAGSEIRVDAFAPGLAPMSVSPSMPAEPAAAVVCRVRFSEELPTVESLVDLLYAEALSRAGGNQTAAARLIGVTASAVNKRLRALAGTGSS